MAAVRKRRRADDSLLFYRPLFIKYAAAHPAVTVVTPATSKPHHMVDNIGAAVGELPDKAMQKRMAEYVDALPSA